jgi:hypothetical protein
MAKSFPNTGVTTGLAADRTAMTGMYAGQQFFETDTSILYIYTGSEWSARPFLSPATGSGTRNTQIDISSTTVTVLSASITPQLTTSKVLIAITGHAYFTTGGDVAFGDKILRGATEIFGRGEFHYFGGTTQHFDSWGISWIDSPATTSSTTYNYQIVGSGRGTCGFARSGGTTGTSIQLLEII